MGSDEAMVARRLRVVRMSRGLTQRELARRSGVGSGTISQIESMASQPSVAVLKKILDAIPMDLGTFFSFELQKSDTVVFRRSELLDIGGPGVQYLLVAATRADKKLQMLHEFYQPGRDSGRRTLSHAGEECGLVVAGRLEVTIGDETHLLERGDSYYFSSTVPHRFRNPGPEVCEVVSTCSPPTF